MLSTKLIKQPSRCLSLTKSAFSSWSYSSRIPNGPVLKLLQNPSLVHQKIIHCTIRGISLQPNNLENLSRRKELYFILISIAVGGAGLYAVVNRLKPKSEKVTEKDPFGTNISPGSVKFPSDSADIPKKVPYLLVGGGSCSFSAFRAIKSRDPRAKVLIVSNEAYFPYMRSPLSKEMWSSNSEDALMKLSFRQWNDSLRSVFYEPKEFFLPVEKLETEPKGGVSIIRGWSVVKLDPEKNLATLDDGTQIEYEKCLLATGVRPKVSPPFANIEQFENKVSVFRNIDDFRKLRSSLDHGVKSVAVIGGCLLGSELACSLAKFDSSKLEVIQIFPEKGNLAKLLPEYLSQWITKKIRGEGVHVIPGLDVKSVALKKQARKVELTLTDNRKIQVDRVIVTSGSEANTDLANVSQLETDPVQGGYLVNSELSLRHDLYAGGDCACYYDPLLGRRRVEHHDHAINSGRIAGENMTGAQNSYSHQPMFWCDLTQKYTFEAIGLIDSSLPTVAVYAKSNLPTETESNEDKSVNTNNADVKQASNISTSLPKEGEDYSKGVIFYLRDDVIVGIILWNIYSKIFLARQILKERRKFEDLNEVAKLFEIHAE